MIYVPYENGAFRTALPDEQGVPSKAILEFLKELDRQNVDIQSLYIFRNGYQLVGANRKPYHADSLRRIYSAAKAITGLAVLFAIQEGYLSFDACLQDIFPEDFPEEASEWLKMMNVTHLLTMTTGHGQDTFRPIMNGENSIRAFLEVPLEYEPGTHFMYNNGVPHVLSLIVKKLTGKDFLEYLKPRFLDVLGIYCTVEKTDKGELEASRTVCTAEGFAKLTLFYLQEGNWNGRQLLDAELVRKATSHQVDTNRCPSITFSHLEELSGYGYQVWQNSVEGARLDGGRNQLGFLFPEKNMAIVLNAIEDDHGLLPSILWKVLYPAITDAARNIDAAEETEKLDRYLENWNCAPKLYGAVVYKDDFYGEEYRLEENVWGLQSVSLKVQDGMPLVTLRTSEQNYNVKCGLNGEWIENAVFLPLPKENERHNMIFGITKPVYRVTGGWASEFCFVFQVRATDWMDYHTFYLRFCGKQMSLCIESNFEKMVHMRKRVPLEQGKYTDNPVTGHRMNK